MGYIVSIPYGNNSRYDLLIDTGEKFIRVQCKTASKNDNGSYTIKTANSVSTTSQRKTKHYTKEEIDCIATIIENQLVIVPVDLICHSESKIFRTEPTKSGAKSNCNFITDYTFEKQKNNL